MKQLLRLLLAALFATIAPLANADEPGPNPMLILGAAKAATGGSAWNDLRTQHSRVTLSTGGIEGPVERWSEFLTGRSYLTYALGPTSGAAGFDGKNGWTQDASGESREETDPTARELAVNAAYRDQLAFWFPSRHPANIVYKSRERRDNADFDVISITPEGGREFDLWINADTHLIERLTEREANATRTEYYMDFRKSGGVEMPFRVRATRGDPRFDEVITVDSIDFSPPSRPIDFNRPPPPKPDYVFPEGKSEVEIPFTLANGHIYVNVKLAGKGPFLMLFDAGGANVLLPQAAKTPGIASQSGKPGGGNGHARTPADVTRVSSVDIGGIVIADQSFVTLPLEQQFERIEGVDHVAGVIGYELLKRFPARVDYARRRITFYQPAPWTYHGNGVKIPIRLKDHIPQVEGSVDGIAGVFDIDTGSRSSLTLTSPFASTNNLVDKYHASGEVIVGAGVGGPSRARLARAKLLKLGDVEVPEPVTLLSTATEGTLADPSLAGDVGYGVLRRFTLVFDYRHQLMWLEKNAAFDDRDASDRAGIWIERVSNGFAVVDVLADGPAAKAGLKAGDVIVAVDGKAAAHVTLDNLRSRLKAEPGTNVKLTLGGGHVVTITLRDLV